jgi:hypothetical protein
MGIQRSLAEASLQFPSVREVDILPSKSTSTLGVRREKAMLFQWVKGPPGEVLPPEATGAAVEVTKPVKPSVKRATKYGDSASVQAVTRVNAEQASKGRCTGRPDDPFGEG